MGTPQFAVPSLQNLIRSQHDVVAVVTQPDRPRGRGLSLSFTPVKEFALQNEIFTILQPLSLKDDVFIKKLDDLKADIFVVVAFRILPESVFSLPRLGTINVHPSLLPKYRGAAPINWTIIRGEKETGVSIIQLSKQIDAGGIIFQEVTPIFPDETAGSLHDRLAVKGADLLMKAIDGIQNGKSSTMAQDDLLATPAPKLKREDCHISFAQKSDQVKNWIHGLSPFPTAYAFLRKDRLNFYKAQSLPDETFEAPPGTILVADGKKLRIACEKGAVDILEIQKEGKKRLPIIDFLRGYSISAGEAFK
jgi:methionyl-tRNA formyltransferase